ncbi:jg12836 [Pararge aegeria aegeria]|uniref:Jg12836 protein n=5 Tax=Pararge aegeria TaxID=116150 RepID=A0A8S4RLE2_9NEOP|nr:jg12836 [Pararge aegeria aegeria]
MRAAEILGGKLSATRQALVGHEPTPSSSSASAEPSVRPEVVFLEDSKNLTSRSKSTAAALAREEQEAASPTRSVKAPTPKCSRTRIRKFYSRVKDPSPDAAERPERLATPDSCCGLDGINIKTGMICEEKHSEILNRERVISICNIDKHDLDDYLNEGNSQEHEEELLQYFHQRDADQDTTANANPADSFLETGQDPHDEHSQGKSEKISQLRELLAKNLKNQSGSNAQSVKNNQDSKKTIGTESHVIKTTIADGAFKPLGNGTVEIVNGTNLLKGHEVNISKNSDTAPNENGISVTCTSENNHNHNQLMAAVGGSHLYNGNCHNEPQSPTTRTQQYDFVPISDGCHSPGNFHSKSPLGFGQRGNSPTKTNKPVIMGGSLQTSPISHSTAASPFVSPRNTPVPRSRFCSRPIPKHNGRKKRNPLTLGVNDPCSKQFAIPNDQKFMPKTSLSGPNIKYCQPMSAPPSPNILSHYKQQMVQNSGIPNGGSNMCLSFIPNAFRENINGELAQPLSADPLSSEVSRFFQEPVLNYRLGHDTSFRSQSVPLKQAPMNISLLSYNNTPVGSVPPTPVPNEFCDFGSLADTCDISKAGLNPETLDKIYDAIDSSNGVLNAGASTTIINTNDALTNGCDPLPDQQILTDDQLQSLMPSSTELLGRSGQYSESFPNDAASADNVEEFLKRTNSIDYDLSELVTEKNKYYTSRSVPSTPLPYKRTAPNLQIDSRLSRELFTAENNYSNISNGISSKSVPSTPQLAEDRSVFSYSNRDFLINGNSVDMCNSNQMRSVENDQGLTSPLDMLREDILVDPLTPSIDPLLADLDKMDGTPYVDL